MNRGKLVIIAIVTVALASAIFSTWYHYRGQHRALDFWGTRTALLIAEGPEVRVYQLGDSAPASEESAGNDNPPPEVADAAPPEGAPEEDLPPKSVEFAGLEWKVAGSQDAKKAKGISNVRRALVQDTTFDWKAPSDQEEPIWEYALVVNDGRYWATLLFDFETRHVALAGGKKTALLDREANADLYEFFVEQFGSEPADAKPQPPADQNGEQPARPAEEPAVKPAGEPTAKPSKEPAAQPTEDPTASK
jgi:hypothetical protein